MTHKLYINAYFIVFGRPSRSSNLVPRLAVVGVVLLAILTDCSSLKQKYLDYDVCSRRWSRTTARPCRARDGVGVIIQAVYNMCIVLPVKNINS